MLHCNHYEQTDSATPDLFCGPVVIERQEGASLPVPRVGHTAVLHDVKVYVGGGNESKSEALCCIQAN